MRRLSLALATLAVSAGLALSTAPAASADAPAGERRDRVPLDRHWLGLLPAVVARMSRHRRPPAEGRHRKPTMGMPLPHLFLACVFGIAIWAALAYVVFVVLRPGW